MLVVSQQARGELAVLTQGLSQLETPVRVLLCPEESAPRLIKSLETGQAIRFGFQRRKKLLFLERLASVPAPLALAPGRMRQATSADAEAISAMIEKQDGELLDPKTLAQALIGSGRAYVWERDEATLSPVALAALGCEDDASVDINTVNTHPSARGQGFAFSFLRTLIADHIAPKAASVLVEEDNKPAQALYKKLGFTFACAWRYAEVGG